MSETSLMRRIVTVGCLALAVSLLAVPASVAAPAPWTKIADKGVTDPNNMAMLPGMIIDGKLTVGAAAPFSTNKVRMYTYDTTFHQLGQPGFGSDNTRLMPWALYRGEVYIGTENTTGGGELWKWSGSGNPIRARDQGWGFGSSYSQVNPVAVYQGKLLVCVGKSSLGAAIPGLRIYQYDGTGWTQIVGQGPAGTLTGPGFGNTANESITATEYSELNGNLIFSVSNSTDGVQVYSYNGSKFARIGQPGAGSWSAAQGTGQVASSHLESKLYLGTGNFFGGGTAELWSYDGSHWAKVALSGGLEDASNFYFQPFVRGADLYVSAWNGNGCRIYKRQGNSFTAFSANGFGNINNVTALLATYNGKMFGETGNPGQGAEVYTTPIAPSVDRLVPNSGPHGTAVAIEGHDFGVARGNSTVTFKGVEARVLSWSDLSIQAVFPDAATTGPVQVKTGRGDSNQVTFSLTLTKTWYLAEGTTAWGFSCYVSIENPNTSAVHAAITYMTGSGNVSGGTIALPAQSQTTVNPADVLGQMDFSTRVTCTEGKTIAVDRTMSWIGQGAASSEGHSSVGVTSPAKTWYLAEGSSAWNFECWLLIQNPNGSQANCTVTYMIEGEAPVTKIKTVPADARKSFNMADDIGSKDASIKVESDMPVIPERAMYRNNRREGHDSIGTTTPAWDFYLAEGATGYNVGYITYVLVQNPNDSPSDVSLTYMTQSGQVAGPSFQMPANSRKTVRLNDQLSPNTDLSTRVHGSKPIIAERAMYWDNGTGEACHDSIGMSNPHKTFYLPDGETSNGRETWTLVQNPNTSDVAVDISYLTPTGTGNVVKTETIPANSRRTFNMLEHSGISGRAAIMVTSKTSGKKIMVERAMYWNTRGAGTDTIGGYSD